MDFVQSDIQSTFFFFFSRTGLKEILMNRAKKAPASQLDVLRGLT